MSQTTYYEFNKPIGSDLVNPLVDEFPNWDIADAALHELDGRSVANATEVVSLGVHAISRLNTYTKFIKWIATANYTAGETFTVDGNVVAASTPSGNALVTGAYVTGAVVVACLNADDSAMTIFVSGDAHATDSDRLGGELPNYYATASDMSNAQTDIGNIKALDGNTSIASIGDGTITGALSYLDGKQIKKKSNLSVSVTAGAAMSQRFVDLTSIDATIDSSVQVLAIVVRDEGTKLGIGYLCGGPQFNTTNSHWSTRLLVLAALGADTTIHVDVYYL